MYVWIVSEKPPVGVLYKIKEHQLAHAFLPFGGRLGFALQPLQTALGLLHTPEQRAYAEAPSEDQMSDS